MSDSIQLEFLCCYRANQFFAALDTRADFMVDCAVRPLPDSPLNMPATVTVFGHVCRFCPLCGQPLRINMIVPRN